ncbi:MAG: 16S rRNA (cytosine(1402)-N(4))-methyltransferase RsmH, partial [Gammaproteobacteria bacterium]|nr:16S rRNA (cytosine(1402)-N(4))-methyltransferase RsmH [Gammaproteobacteria bacterium]
RGGHSSEIFKNLSQAGRLLVLDQDPQAVAHARKLFAGDGRVMVESANFSSIVQIAEAHGWRNKVKGILFDLGVSSPQLDDPKRGFSFVQDGPLDMRMNTNEGISAADWIQRASLHELEKVLKVYGEERHAKKIARAVLAQRETSPLRTTGQLAEIVKRSIPASGEKKHPATRTFQAIRIFINKELQALETALHGSVEVLAEYGRLLVVTFHSLEDQMVKSVYRKHSQSDVPRKLPVVGLPESKLKRIGKPVSPSSGEIAANKRARSAKLYVMERAAC